MAFGSASREAWGATTRFARRRTPSKGWRASRIAPRTVRILFTGTLGIKHTVEESGATVGLFRAIYKPASTAELLAALDEAVREYDQDG